jgi:hypothetical protein
MRAQHPSGSIVATGEGKRRCLMTGGNDAALASSADPVGPEAMHPRSRSPLIAVIVRMFKGSNR